MRQSAALLAAALLLGACATAVPRDDVISPHRERARTLERDGQLRAALLEWKVVRAIEPDNAEARAEQTRLESRIHRRASERLAEARAALARGATSEARRKLLAVLALEPDNATAISLLRGGARDGDSIIHVVRAGDTLASLAERYYGDRSRSEVIWETNRLPPGRPLVVGRTLRIPEISGVPFHTPGSKPVTPATSVAIATPAPMPAPARTNGERNGERTPAQDEPPEVNPMLADIRDAVDRKDYATALGDIDRYLALNPSEREALELKKLTLYRQGYAQIEQKSYDDGYKTLLQLARIQPDYLDVGSLVQQARRHAIDYHYQEGIRHFREERLQEAINEWRVVLNMDAQHPNARRNIEQAERLLEALERRKSR